MFLKKFIGLLSWSRPLAARTTVVNCSISKNNFATKMRATVTKNKKDSAGKRLGVKKFGGEEVKANDIIVRQRGFKFKPGENVHYGKDQSIHASKEGKVSFSRNPWDDKKKTYVHVIEQEIPNRKLFPPYPFFYHPELFPERATANKEIEPLIEDRPVKRINPEKRGKETNKKEVKVIKNGSSLKEDVELHALNARTIHPKNYTNRFEIEPLLEQITQTGVRYFVPDLIGHQDKIAQIEKYRLEAEKRNMVKLPEADLPRDSHEYLSFGHKKTFSQEDILPYSEFILNNSEGKVMQLRDLLVEMKKENLLTRNLDLRKVPYEETISEADLELAYSEELRNLAGRFDYVIAKERESIQSEIDELYIEKQNLDEKIEEEITGEEVAALEQQVKKISERISERENYLAERLHKLEQRREEFVKLFESDEEQEKIEKRI